MSKRVAWLFVALMMVLGCQGNESPIVVREVWGPESPPVAENGVFYMKISNTSVSDEQLTAVTSPACTAAELHETYEKENGLMGMRHLPGGVAIAAGETVSLAVGGFHVMCLNKTADFSAGTQIPLSLTFSNAGLLETEAEIR